MPGDDLYKNLKDPAPDSLPKFEEESWRKMELLLDKYLPEDKGRGRVLPYILFLGCIILASLTTFLPAKRSVQFVDGISSTSNSASKPFNVSEKKDAQQLNFSNEHKPTSDLAKNDDTKTQPTPVNEHLISSNLPLKKIVISKLGPVRNTTTTFPQFASADPQQKEFVNDSKPTAIEDILLKPDGPASLTNTNGFVPKTKALEQHSLISKGNEEKPATKKLKKNGLSLTFSAGLETPGTAFNTWGRLTPVVGVGLMYNIGGKLILRTGVVVADKIYSAHDKDYNPANNYWASYTYFKRIDADCKVIEIPLGIAYRIVGGKKTNLFVSAGSSSIIMRKEGYEYYYKNQAGRDTVTHRAWNNNSFHLFSSVNLSAIAERKISNRFSLMAEPAIKIPTGGIGVGKIRLYNAGLTVTAKFKLR